VDLKEYIQRNETSWRDLARDDPGCKGHYLEYAEFDKDHLDEMDRLEGK
jgi:hypothetical protein